MGKSKSNGNFYVPSVQPNHAKINQYILQLVLILIIFITAVIADASLLK